MRIAVVGAGLAGARFAQQYRALGGQGELTVYGAEERVPYNRVLLAEVLSGRYDPEAIALPYGPGVALRTGCEVLAVDPSARRLSLAGGESADYDELVLATGANPVLPPLRGLRGSDGLKAGVHAFRTLADCARLAEDAATAKRAVVIGGGVLGVSAARALAALGMPVEIVHQAPHLIERQLDERAAEALRLALARLGVESYLGNRARALQGEDRVTGVELASGYLLDADLVVLACGVRPRTGLAHAAGLAVRSGVLVDDRLRASAPGSHAIGDCAEHRGSVHGLAEPAYQQADLLAARLSGADPTARYTGSRPLARLTAGPLEYAAFGDTAEDQPGTDVLRLADPTRGSYKKLVLRGDRLVGGILLGDLATVGALTRAYERDDPLPPDPLPLLTTHRGVRP
ncbi:NAD(P)/FAD-dependent oxidoreductase [Kitasatospora azatica]|uniref:NAD(P)/FAD-dependent oxidoreductase n=1 Tax=Kitasatospora azatica TaxID=58347 RepID=UPI000A660BEE|nr:FAD-dependent oxidoreductase [Kitasatospora azatica]